MDAGSEHGDCQAHADGYDQHRGEHGLVAAAAHERREHGPAREVAEFRARLSKEFAHLYHDLEGGIDFLACFNPYLPLPAYEGWVKRPST